MDHPPIKPHYQRYEVEVVTQQSPNRPHTLEVPARTAKEAVDSTVNGGARDYGYYDWIKVSSGNESTERDNHPGGTRRD